MHKSPKMKKAKIYCRKRMRRSSHSEQFILNHYVVFPFTVCLGYFEAPSPIKLWHQSTSIGVRTGDAGGGGAAAPPIFWATQVFWAAREIWANGAHCVSPAHAVFRQRSENLL